MKRSELIPGQVYRAKVSWNPNFFLIMAHGKRALMHTIRLGSDEYIGKHDFNDGDYSFEPADSMDAAWMEACIKKGHTVNKKTVVPKLENYPIW